MAGWDNPMREFERLRIENAGLRAEVAEWKRRRDAAVEQCRHLHQDGKTREQWHLDNCGAMAEVARLREERDGVRAERDAEWVTQLAVLCDDEWLRRRDRAMEAPGSKGHRWERRAASAWETAARSVRAVLNDLANYEDEWVDHHAAYKKWMRNGRDLGERP